MSLFIHIVVIVLILLSDNVHTTIKNHVNDSQETPEKYRRLRGATTKRGNPERVYKVDTNNFGVKDRREKDDKNRKKMKERMNQAH